MSKPRSFMIDHAHVDPCRSCHGMFFRDEMVPAREVKVYGIAGKWQRGWVCRRCEFRASGENQTQLFTDVSGAVIDESNT